MEIYKFKFKTRYHNIGRYFAANILQGKQLKKARQE